MNVNTTDATSGATARDSPIRIHTPYGYMTPYDTRNLRVLVRAVVSETCPRNAAPSTFVLMTGARGRGETCTSIPTLCTITLLKEDDAATLSGSGSTSSDDEPRALRAFFCSYTRHLRSLQVLQVAGWHSLETCRLQREQRTAKSRQEKRSLKDLLHPRLLTPPPRCIPYDEDAASVGSGDEIPKTCTASSASRSMLSYPTQRGLPLSRSSLFIGGGSGHGDRGDRSGGGNGGGGIGSCGSPPPSRGSLSSSSLFLGASRGTCHGDQGGGHGKRTDLADELSSTVVHHQRHCNGSRGSSGCIAFRLLRSFRLFALGLHEVIYFFGNFG